MATADGRVARTYLTALICGLVGLFIWLHFLPPTFVIESTPQFYANALGDPLDLLLLERVKASQKTLFLESFGLTWSPLLFLLNQKAEEGQSVTVRADRKDRFFLKRKLSSLIDQLPPDTKGLMHRKVVIIDDQELLVGSANLTRESLLMHSNLLMSVESKEVAQALKNSSSCHARCPHQELQLFVLPQDKEIEKRLLGWVESAKKSIKVAMFHFSHSKLAKSLIDAKKRGIAVYVIVDKSSLTGKSALIAQELLANQIPLNVHKGQELFHHKFALIDDRLLIHGSANWSANAFHRNSELVIALWPLNETQVAFFKKLWRVLQITTERQKSLS